MDTSELKAEFGDSLTFWGGGCDTRDVLPNNTPQQVAELPTNMRRTEQCERERLPLIVQLEIDGDLVAQIDAPPSGLWNDGPASVYERIEVEPGAHRIAVRLRDSARTDGWDYSHAEQVMLQPGRYFTIRFRADSGGFIFR